jgi:hypothetical protein
MATGADKTHLSDTQVAEVMRLLGGVDSVEIKATVPAKAHRATIQGLPLDPVEAQPRQVFFFDTPDLRLDAAGVVVRARRIQGGRGDTVIKLRPVQPETLPADVRRSASFNVELDALPGGFVCSGSYKGKSTGQEIRDAVAGRLPLRKLFAKDQRAFYTEHAPTDLSLDDLIPLGPVFILKAVFGVVLSPTSKLEHKFVAEVWTYPDGSRIVELSTKCQPSEAFEVGVEMRSYMADRGIPLVGGQQTKTRAAMKFFGAELAAAKGD